MGIQLGEQTAPAASSSASTVTVTGDPLIEKFGQLHVLDDLIRLRVADFIQYPILAYPESEKDAASYTYYTGRDLDTMIDQTVTVLMNDGFQPVRIHAITAIQS